MAGLWRQRPRLCMVASIDACHLHGHVRSCMNNAPASAGLCRRKLQSRQPSLSVAETVLFLVKTLESSISISPPSCIIRVQLPGTQAIYSASFHRGPYRSTYFNHCCELGSCTADVCFPTPWRQKCKIKISNFCSSWPCLIGFAAMSFPCVFKRLSVCMSAS